jgi:glycosyltransferase involved in cell wall biosynthesis
MHIAIIHPNMASAGGAESYCMRLLEYFQKRGNTITFITDKKIDLKRLNEKFNNTVDVKKITVIRPMLCRIIGTIEPHVHLLSHMEFAFFTRYLKKHDDFDLAISTKGEMDLGKPGMQVMPHPPNLSKASLLGGLYLWFLRLLGQKKENISANITICHSEYIRFFYGAEYGGTNSFVIYPPIRKSTKSVAWDKRENGFVILGRIEKDKQTDKAIELIGKLNERGMDTHLHIIGNGSGAYYEKIRRMTGKDDKIHLEGFVDNDRYFDIVTAHKFALHMKKNEPAAVTIREAINSGCIVFGNDSGGTSEIFDYNDDLLFDTDKEALQKIMEVMSHSLMQKVILRDMKKLKVDRSDDWEKELDRLMDLWQKKSSL